MIGLRLLKDTMILMRTLIKIGKGQFKSAEPSAQLGLLKMRQFSKDVY
jgi:hypothetical protein